MKTPYAIRIEAGQKNSLSKIPTGAPKELNKETALEKLDGVGQELSRLQELMYAAGTHSLLVILQGMDTSGKDGTIRGVMGYVNPQGCRVESFKTPSPEELAHDYLWRVHRVTPAKGMIAVFNRSHYEDVLIVRVQNLVPEKVWKARYGQINAFEELLTHNNTIVVKCFLHISKDEQEERLLAREAEVEKAWKLSQSDWENRKLWNEYQKACYDALTKCSTDYAPWHVIPADKKWFRNLAVAQLLVETLKPYEKEWKKVLALRSEAGIAQLKAYREQNG